jgi:hypothetical protein
MTVNWETFFPAKNVNKVSNVVKSLKQNFPKVFSGGPGPIEWHETNIILKPYAVPVSIPRRIVCIPIRGNSEQELTRMVDSIFWNQHYPKRGGHH